MPFRFLQKKILAEIYFPTALWHPSVVMNEKLPRIPEEPRLETFSDEGQPFLLGPEAADAWKIMKQAAERDGIHLYIVSAFRSVARQTEIIENKRSRGIPDAEIFNVSAPAGYSEHHSGRAIDLNTTGCPELEGDFENTAAFQWLTENAARFGFHLSYPRNNSYGIAYEPWHWCFTGRL